MAGSRNNRSNDPVALAVATATARHPGLSVAIAYSGGLDSSVLLHCTAGMAGALGLAVKAIHVNHRLHPNADHWERFCRRQSQRLGVPLVARRVAVPSTTGQGLEAAARQARYGAFETVPADMVLLGHHRDDQAETVLFNLCRGGGPKGVSGMRMARGRYVRPFLELDRATLERYARAHGVEWIEDDSNADPALTRNYLRHELLPRLECAIPAASRNIAAAADRFREACVLLDDLARLDLAEHAAGFPVPRRRFRDLPELRARNALRYLLDQAGVPIPGDERLREAVRQLQSARPDRHPEILFGEWRVRCARGAVTLDRSV